MDNPICPQCGGECKLIPAGVSKKSGKPYDAFWGCKTYGCNGTVRMDGDVRAQKSIINQTSDNINRFEAKKEESMKVLASNRDATLIVVALMNQGGAWTDEITQTKLKEWAKWFKNNLYDPPFVG